MNADVINEIEAYILPANPLQALLPASAVVEVVSVATMIPVSKKPNWYLGKLGWQGRTLPMVAFSRLHMPDAAMGQFRYAAIVRTANATEELPLFALALSEPAKKFVLQRNAIVNADAELTDSTAAYVMVGQEAMYIPNINYIEALVASEQT